MSKLLSRLLGLVMVVSATSASANADLVKKYKDNGKQVMDAILAKKVDPKVVGPLLEKMADDALALSDVYIGKNPDGKKMFELLKKNFDNVKKASFEELEKDWHDLGFFAKPGNEVGMDLKQEKNEHYTDPLHCIIHPLMTLRAAEKSPPDLQAMKEELSEGLEQMELMAKKL